MDTRGAAPNSDPPTNSRLENAGESGISCLQMHLNHERELLTPLLMQNKGLERVLENRFALFVFPSAVLYFRIFFAYSTFLISPYRHP